MGGWVGICKKVGDYMNIDKNSILTDFMTSKFYRRMGKEYRPVAQCIKREDYELGTDVWYEIVFIDNKCHVKKFFKFTDGNWCYRGSL